MSGTVRWRRLFAPAICLVLAFTALAVLQPAAPASAATCPCSIWPASATPATPSDPDTTAVEVGMKFRSDVDGAVTGVRFYKGTGNTGTHVGHLWTLSGTLLATVTFTGETASGWQQATFATPVSVAANTTYVVSYYAPNGRYAGDTGYFASSGVDNAPLHALADGVDGANGVYRYGTGGGFPTNTWEAANYWVDVVFDTSVADTTPPTVTATNPAANATGVPVGTAVAATLSETVQAGTASLAVTSAGGPVAGTTSYDATNRTVTFTPSAALAASTAYTATASGARDPSGNTMSPFTWSFTTAAATAGCPCTIWPDTATPATASVNDNSAVEVGVKFRANQAGFVTGLRFYKGSANTGTHVGSLWSSGGARLGTVTFSGESASGWQTATLPSPVPVTANTTYVASYHTGTGFYSATGNGLASAVTRGPLTALASGSTGGNGVYAYGAGGFPTGSYQATNYWVDVVFNQTAADSTPPAIAARTPAPGASGVATTAPVTATFSEPVTASSVAMSLAGPGGAAVAGSTAYDAATNTATFTPAAALANSTSYTASVSGARDAAGNVMSPVTWSFTTAAPPPPPPDQGPGGPVLVIKNGAGFTGFAAEVLRAEGLNAFATAELSTVTSAVLDQYHVVLLGATTLTPAQVTMFTTWVTGGGNLVAFRPDKQLATLLGLVSTTGTLANGYLRVDTSSAPGAGITGQTIQFHGTADRYTLAGARAVATLYSTATAATANPAVTLVNVGASGGQAAAFTYDLPQSLVQTRQGNPAWDGQERDGAAPIRSDDLYFGGSSADWVDLGKVAIPQADEQQRLLANLIGAMNLDRTPLPRFWYFPRSLKAVVVATGDDHGNGGTAGRFNQYLANSPPGCVVDNWQCPRFTSYVYTSTPLSNAQAASYNASGFEIGLHVNTNCANYTASSIASTYSTQLSQWRQKYSSLPAPVTNRTHCIVWSDWSSQASTAAANGIRLDTNYYYWPGSWVSDRPGFMTGSGMPMRFAGRTGTLLDAYQAATQLTDESGQSYPFTPDTLLDNALGPLGYYGAFTANMHTDQATTFPSDQVLASAQARGVPIITARQLLTWLNGRNGSSFAGITRSGNTLTFTVNVGAGANGLTGMVPTAGTGGTTLSGLAVGGGPVAFTRTTVKGVEYAMFLAAPGTYTATYAAGGGAAARTALAPPQPATAALTAPLVSNVEVSPLPDGTAGVSWRTGTRTSGTLLIGSTPDTLAPLSASGTGTDHTVVATGLRPDATYHYRIRGVDAAGNAVVWPPAGREPASFVSAPVGVADRTAAQFRTGKGGGTAVRPGGLGALALAPGNRSGSRVSRVLDAGQMVTWDRLTYGATVPIGCSVRISVRTGSTSTPDASWSAWTPVAQGGRIKSNSRYIQYRVDLTTVRPGRTPTLHHIGITNNAPYTPPQGEVRP
ncbi:DUF4082 domain-containing protein [Phytohabitans houttuyneae]|uniref:Fibronectin type-III domain-containing protein n=1 Tax=Phytohabitans houttuyneae TaxID=1076126 RepID=A0A6V8K197_9ACTN|nr:DUF4082 domain-containing protein [Phytohabitans houttuyneae]GFJ76151.1 hypothetical protein Phou_003310 [Phytohabitans houttuyneae]